MTGVVHVAVSVVVPAYNDPQGIGLLLDALLRQTGVSGRWEIVVADNGSTDATPDIVRRYEREHPGKVRLVVETNVRSSYAARNAGVRAAVGAILAFTDADCVPDPGWLAQGVLALEKKGAGCGGGRIDFFFKNERPNVCEFFDSDRKLNQEHYVTDKGFAATANFFVLRELFDRHGGFRDDLISGGDYEFGRRLTSAGVPLIYIPDAVVRHPARATFREILKKTRRVAEGMRQLADRGLHEQGCLTWRNWRPTLEYVRPGRLPVDFSIGQRLRLVALANACRYTANLIRIR